MWMRNPAALTVIGFIVIFKLASADGGTHTTVSREWMRNPAALTVIGFIVIFKLASADGGTHTTVSREIKGSFQ